MTAKGKPRKPMGRFWCGNWLLVDSMVQSYGLKNLRDLHSWLGKVIAWGETVKKAKKKGEGAGTR